MVTMYVQLMTDKCDSVWKWFNYKTANTPVRVCSARVLIMHALMTEVCMYFVYRFILNYKQQTQRPSAPE